MKKESILFAFLSGFCVYLDIILKVVYSNVNEIHAMGDYWWLFILILIFVLYVICIYKESLVLNIITYIFGFAPIIVFVFYLLNMEANYLDADWKLVVIYMMSEIILLIPSYILQMKKIIKTYKNEI